MARANEYPQGATVRTRATITVDGVATDPTACTVTIRKPDGTKVGPVAATDDAGDGAFHHDVVADQIGTWRYRYDGTGPAAGAGEGAFKVLRSRVL